MQSHYLKVIDSWKLSHDPEIIANIQHGLNGLKPGTVVTSLESGKAWRITHRIIFLAAKSQIRFPEEHERSLHISFLDPYDININKFREDIKENESKGIFQYAIIPINHVDRPEA